MLSAKTQKRSRLSAMLQISQGAHEISGMRISLEKRTEIQAKLVALTAQFPQPACGRDSVARCIKDLLEPETNLVQRP